MIKENIKNYINDSGSSHILIHSDLLFGFKTKFENQEQYIADHYRALKEVCQPLHLIMPAFNYDFCKGIPFKVNEEASQVGALTEYFRNNYSSWRSSMPVFNFSGTGENPISSQYGKVDPFDENSVFGFLHQNNGLLMHYGSGFHTTTLIHYAERISKKLIYRYDKQFAGEVIDAEDSAHHVEMFYHVRPMGQTLNYDWERIESDLVYRALLTKFKEKRTQISIGNITKIVDYWLSCLEADPFYFLEKNTRQWVSRKYEELKRPFNLNDFEHYEKRN